MRVVRKSALVGGIILATAGCVLTHENLNSVLWMQTAAEYRASTEQGYALATLRLDQALDNLPAWDDAVLGTKCAIGAKTAVIVDVDETIFDNSPTQARAVKLQIHHFDKAYWEKWQAEGTPEAIPGAVAFLRHAASRQVTVFYITNRDNKEGLKRVLSKLEFPMSPSVETILPAPLDKLGKPMNDKQGRRDAVAKDYAVLLSVGDDLGDFVSLFGADLSRRRALLESNRDRWGREWIVLPNPTYGSWETSLAAPGGSDSVRLKEKRKALRLPPDMK